MHIENSEENQKIYDSLKKALDNRNYQEQQNLVNDPRVIIEIPSITKLQKDNEENEMNVYLYA